MKRPSLFLIAFLLTLNIFSQKGDLSKWPRGITYEIYVQSFADSNGDGKGDIKGMTGKLDYLMDLGVSAVWLMPINPSGSYHKYDVKDYYNIDPDYGTLDDFKTFVKEAHKRNIKVVIDMVLNHSSRDNPWFQQALKDSTSPYWNYYVWTRNDDPQASAVGNATAGETRRRNHWVSVPGTDYLYYAQFGGHMPDLNYDNPKVREEAFKIGKFWASEVKVDGFRLDAARHIFPDERARENHLWWEYFLQEMRKINKDFYLVGEVWAPSEVVGPYLNGIPALFDFDMAGEIIKAVNSGNADSLAIRHKKIRDFYRSVNPNYVDATFLTNHDQNRIMSVVNDNEQKARIAAAILLTLPGSPYLYYGEEIGMKGKKPDEFIREPFIWDIKPRDNIRATWEQPRFTTDTSITSEELQKDNPESLFNYYRNFIRLRNKSKALTFGEIMPVVINEKSISAFTRSFEDEDLLIIHNVSNAPIRFDLAPAQKNYSRLYYKTNGAGLDNNTVTMPEYSCLILKKIVN